jgi:tight adherence protein B
MALAIALVLWPSPAGPGVRLGKVGGVGASRWARETLSSPVIAGLGALAAGAAFSTPLVAVLAGGCTALAARALAARLRSAVSDGRLLELAAALGVLAAELRAGRSLDGAANAAAAACPTASTGPALVTVLRSRASGTVLADRDDLDPDLARIGAAVELSVRTGCSLAAVLVAIEDDLRARHRQRAELRSATAGPRASATVLAGLPAVGLAMGSGVGADPWHVLTTTGVGQVLLVLGVLLELCGIAWTGLLTRRAVPALFADDPAHGV